MNFGLSEKTVLLTGATSGLGRAIAIQLAELGANITLVDKNEDRVQRLATEIMDQREVREEYGRAAAIVSDITKPHHVKEAVRKSAEVFGGIDIYIDALIAANECSIENENLEDLDRMIDVNLKAPFLITNEVVKFLKERRRSRILYIIPDYAAWGGEGESIVAATRTGLSSLAKSVARECAAHHMTVNCLSVGPTEDYLVTRSKDAKSARGEMDKLLKKNAYLELTDANDIARTVAFLASGLSGAINGQTIIASNGLR